MGMLGWIFGKKKVVFIKRAKIVFNDEYDDVPVNDPLLKTILVYVRDELVDEKPYSSVITERLQREGVPILDTTLEPNQWLPSVGIELGKVDIT